MRIWNASPGAHITLRTDGEGWNTKDPAQVDKVLNALAEKLYYYAYGTECRGDTGANLTGQVEIAEGLTSGAKWKKIGDISFEKIKDKFSGYKDAEAADSSTLTEEEQVWGHGKLKPGSVKSEEDTPPTPPVESDFNTPITGDKKKDIEYVKKGIYDQEERSYHFTKETKINVGDKTVTDGIVTVVRPEKEVIINSDENLTLQARTEKEDSITGSIYANKELTTSIMMGEGKELHILAKGGKETVGVMAKEKAEIKVIGNVSTKTEGKNIKGIVAENGAKIEITGKWTYHPEESSIAIDEDKGEIHITNVDIITKGTVLRGKKGKITIDSGYLEAKEGGLLADIDCGAEYGSSFTMGDINKEITLIGDIKKEGQNNEVYINLGKGSSWTGGFINDSNIFDLNIKGGIWNNTRRGWICVNGSYNGASAEESGILHQTKDSGDITIKFFDFGGTTDKGPKDSILRYDHDEQNPATVYGGHIYVHKFRGPNIVVQTGDEGLNLSENASEGEKNKVNETLNALANKFYMTVFSGIQDPSKPYNLGFNGYIEIKGKDGKIRRERMSYKVGSGQGYYSYKQDKAQSDTNFTTTITGVESKDKIYTDKGVLKENGLYCFEKESQVQVEQNEKVDGIVSVIRSEDATFLQANKKLTLSAKTNKAEDKAIAVYVKYDKKWNQDPIGDMVGIDRVRITSSAEGITLKAEGGKENIGIYGESNTKMTGQGKITIETNGENQYGIFGEEESNIEVEKLIYKNMTGGVAVKTKGMVTIKNADISTTGTALQKDQSSDPDFDTGKISVLGGSIEAKKGAKLLISSSGYVEFGNAYSSTELLLLKGDMELNNNSEGISINLKYHKNETDPEKIYDKWFGGFENKGNAEITVRMMGGIWKNTKPAIIHEMQATDTGGVIDQSAENNSLVISNYEDSQDGITVYYDHDANDPMKIIGGDIHIQKANKSKIYLRTDAKGLNTAENATAKEKNLLNATLNALANKLWYDAYADKEDKAPGERNLIGKLEIAEGLTTPRIEKNLKDITFKTKDGQGEYIYTPEDEPSPQPNPQKLTAKDFFELWKTIPGNENKTLQDFFDSFKAKDGYTLWKELPGNENKTEKDYLDSLKPEGPYDIWKKQPGNENKTEKDFIDSLKSKDAYDLWKELPENKGKTVKDYLDSLKPESPYDIWKKQPGNENKTDKDYLDSLKPEGPYDIWKKQPGNENKTEKDYLDSLKPESLYELWKKQPGNENKTEKDFIDTQKTKDAFDLWKELPENKGKTVKDYLDSLKPESPYDIWKKQPGNENKAEKDYLDSLKPEGLYDIWKKQPGNENKTEKDFLDEYMKGGKKGGSENPSGEIDKKEYTAVKSIKNAIFSSVLIWQSQNNDLQKRLGDIRSYRAESGIWAKYQGGSVELDTKDIKNQRIQWTYKYNGIQVGYDKKVGDWTIGAAFGYIKNDDTYLSGTGNGTTISGSVYGTQVREDGSYIDLIAKVGRVENDYDVYTEKNIALASDRAKGSYKTNGMLLSLEYGKRVEQVNGFYYEPSIELAMSRVSEYESNIESKKGVKMNIHTDAVYSLIGKLGFAVGQKLDGMSFYGKLSVAHEFGGDIKTRFTSGTYQPDTHIKMEDTWLDLELGGSYRMSDSSYFYGTFTKNFGAKLNNKWRLDTGFRFAF